jgi:hypothetical protein
MAIGNQRRSASPNSTAGSRNSRRSVIATAEAV